jgi:hypothetical protein
MNFLRTMRAILDKEKRERAKRVSCAPGPSHLTDALPHLTAGVCIEWNSPLLGLIQGEVLNATFSDVVVWHPRLDGVATIERAWVTRIVLPSPKGDPL